MGSDLGTVVVIEDDPNIADLIDLARLDTDRMSLHIVPTDVEAVVESTVAGFLPRAAAAGIRLSPAMTRSATSPGRWMVTADPDRLAQVIANLVDNALTFARTSVALSVIGPSEATMPSAGLSRPAPFATGIAVVVEDDGAGIRPEDLGRIFERFYQADRAGPKRGAGVGLAIVAELVRAMGGSVDAESPISPAGGTRVIVRLPGFASARA